MDRRQLLGKGAMALLAVQAGESIFTACTKAESMSKKPVVTPGNKPNADPSKLKIRFLGTGAADWTKATYRGEHRNFSSILVDDDFLIDYTSMSNSMLPEGAAPTTIFIRIHMRIILTPPTL